MSSTDTVHDIYQSFPFSHRYPPSYELSSHTLSERTYSTNGDILRIPARKSRPGILCKIASSSVDTPSVTLYYLGAIPL